MVPDDNSKAKIVLNIEFLPPTMISHVLNFVSFLGVHCEDLGDHVFGLKGKMLGDPVLSRQYLLIEFGGLLILERQAPTKHGIEDDSTAPNVDKEWVIFGFSLNHFRSGIAGRPTGGFKSLFWITNGIQFR